MKSIFSKLSIAGIIALGILSFNPVAQVKASQSRTSDRSQQMIDELAKSYLKSDVFPSWCTDKTSDATKISQVSGSDFCGKTWFLSARNTPKARIPGDTPTNNLVMTELANSSPPLEMNTRTQVSQ